jgi:hypothetical protein
VRTGSRRPCPLPLRCERLRGDGRRPLRTKPRCLSRRYALTSVRRKAITQAPSRHVTALNETRASRGRRCSPLSLLPLWTSRSAASLAGRSRMRCNASPARHCRRQAARLPRTTRAEQRPHEWTPKRPGHSPGPRSGWAVREVPGRCNCRSDLLLARTRVKCVGNQWCLESVPDVAGDRDRAGRAEVRGRAGERRLHATCPGPPKMGCQPPQMPEIARYGAVIRGRCVAFAAGARRPNPASALRFAGLRLLEIRVTGVLGACRRLSRLLAGALRCGLFCLRCVRLPGSGFCLSLRFLRLSGACRVVIGCVLR